MPTGNGYCQEHPVYRGGGIGARAVRVFHRTGIRNRQIMNRKSILIGTENKKALMLERNFHPVHAIWGKKGEFAKDRCSKKGRGIRLVGVPQSHRGARKLSCQDSEQKGSGHRTCFRNEGGKEEGMELQKKTPDREKLSTRGQLRARRSLS